ncbi:MAG: hypothetical protein K2L67_02220 [Clostridia bacterium]|nr:hypothetical protein [Clostridia bacterium]
MSERKKRLIYRISAFIVCACIVIAAPFIMFSKDKKAAAEGELTVLNVWQIDNFEGGKGSRAAYLQNAGNNFSKTNECYVTVTSITAEAATENLNKGTVPDLISYGAGMSGLERFITGKMPFNCWCYGGYCLLSIEQNADFSKATADNTIINAGTGNRITACSLLIGLNGADIAQPTAAYVKLINGGYKFLLGTQRDVFRLKTRGVAFSVKPLTEFNDLYQNISITAQDGKKRAIAEKFIEKLLSESKNISKLGLFSDNQTLYEDELHAFEGLSYGLTLKTPLGEEAKNELDGAILNSDVNLIKNLLK